jgi:SAM-dependent methyltransferase
MSVAAEATTVYRRDPTDTIDGIPTFCARDPFTKNYDAIAAEHLEWMAKGTLNPWQATEGMLVLEGATAAFVRYLSNPGSRILDVGVATGRVLALLPEWERYGIDIARAYLKVAAQLGIEVAVGRAEDLPYADSTFDTVIATDVLEHVLDLNAVVAEVMRVLRPGGIFVVRVPREEDLNQYLDASYRFLHLRKFDQATLRLLLTRIFPFEILLETDVSASGGNEILIGARKP